MGAFHDAVRELEPDRVSSCVEQCELAKARIEGKIKEVCEEPEDAGGDD